MRNETISVFRSLSDKIWTIPVGLSYLQYKYRCYVEFNRDRQTFHLVGECPKCGAYTKDVPIEEMRSHA